MTADKAASPVSCQLCGHEWRRHDPEDGRCDAPSSEYLGACLCGRDLRWVNERIALLSRAALGVGALTRRDNTDSPVQP